MISVIHGSNVTVAGVNVPEFGGVIHLDVENKLMVISIQEPTEYPIAGDELTFLCEAVYNLLGTFIRDANGGLVDEPKKEPT